MLNILLVGTLCLSVHGLYYPPLRTYPRPPPVVYPFNDVPDFRIFQESSGSGNSKNDSSAENEDGASTVNHPQIGGYYLFPNQATLVNILRVAPLLANFLSELPHSEELREFAGYLDPFKVVDMVVRISSDPETNLRPEQVQFAKYVATHHTELEGLVHDKLYASFPKTLDNEANRKRVADINRFQNTFLPKLLFAAEGVKYDRFLEESISKLGIKPDFLVRLYGFVVGNAEKLVSNDAGYEVDRAFGLQVGSYYKIKRFIEEDTSIYNAYRKLLNRIAGKEDGPPEVLDKVQNAVKKLLDAARIRGATEHLYKNSIRKILKSLLEKPALLGEDGALNLPQSSDASKLVQKAIQAQLGQDSGSEPFPMAL